MLSRRADRGFCFLTGEWFVLFQVALSQLDAFGVHLWMYFLGFRIFMQNSLVFHDSGLRVFKVSTA